MRLPGFVFGGASFGRDRRDARPAGKARRRRNSTHRLGGEMLEGRAVLAVIVPPPTISHVLDDQVPVVGTVSRGSSTNDRTLTLTGTAQPGSTVKVFANGDALGDAKLVGSTWRFTTGRKSTGELHLPTDGVYTFTAEVTRAGTTTVTSPYPVTLDTMESTPSIAKIFDNVGNQPPDVKALELSNDTTLDIQGIANAGSEVRIFDGRNLLGTAVANGGGTWTFHTRPLTNGQTYRFAAQATDRAGNTSVVSSASRMLIDTTPPWRPLITGVTDASRAIADRGVTNQQTLTISGRAEARRIVNVPGGSPIIVPGCKVELFVRDTSTNPVTDTLVGTVDEVGVDGNWSITVPGLAERPHLFYARATDAAGNKSVLPSVNYTVTVDLTAPAAPTILSAIDASGRNRGAVNSGGATDDTRPRFTGTTPEPGTRVKIYDGTVCLGPADVTGSTWSFQPKSPLAPGIHTLTATAIDLAGNKSAAGSFTIDIDTTGPSFTGFGTRPIAKTYGLGDDVVIELEFDEPVYVDTTDGTPQILLNTQPPRYAIYDSGSGTGKLVFKYEPQLGDKSDTLDFKDSAAIDPNGGSIRDAAGNDVNRSLGSLAGRGITVDAKLTILDPQSPPNSNPLPKVTHHADGKTIDGFAKDDPSLPELALSQITLTFNAPLTSGLTTRSFDLFFENRSMSTEDVVIEKLSDDEYRLTLPPSTHQSLSGYYRLVIGHISGREDMSHIKSGDVLMEDAVALHWYKPPSA